jgi:hypothetical protein
MQISRPVGPPESGGQESGEAGRYKWMWLMSESVRWKEYRVRQEIYKERLRQREISAHEVDSNGAEPDTVNQVSISFFEQMLGTRWDERIELQSNT